MKKLTEEQVTALREKVRRGKSMSATMKTEGWRILESEHEKVRGKMLDAMASGNESWFSAVLFVPLFFKFLVYRSAFISREDLFRRARQIVADGSAAFKALKDVED